MRPLALAPKRIVDFTYSYVDEREDARTEMFFFFFFWLAYSEFAGMLRNAYDRFSLWGTSIE